MAGNLCRLRTRKLYTDLFTCAYVPGADRIPNPACGDAPFPPGRSHRRRSLTVLTQHQGWPAETAKDPASMVD